MSSSPPPPMGFRATSAGTSRNSWSAGTDGCCGAIRRRPSRATTRSCRTSPRHSELTCRGSTMPEFDFAVLGAGAIGSIIGAHLVRAGHRVAMLARGARAAHLEQHGLTIRGLTEFTTPVRTLREPQALRSAGALIIATKTPGTAAALEPLRAAQFDVTLSIQNGPLKNE